MDGFKNVGHSGIAIVVTMFGALACASAAQAMDSDTSWVSKPAWANDSSPRSNTNRSEKRAPRESRDRISPFSPDSSNLSLDVGQVFMMGDLGSDYSDAIGGRLNYTYGVSDMFGFNTTLGHNGHAGKSAVNNGAKYSMTYLTAGMRANLAWFDKVIPYAVVGLGFYRPSYHFPEANQSIAPVVFGLNLGPGISLQLTRELSFGVSLTFHDMFGADRQSVRGPLAIGGTFSTFFLSAGYTL